MGDRGPGWTSKSSNVKYSFLSEATATCPLLDPTFKELLIRGNMDRRAQVSSNRQGTKLPSTDAHPLSSEEAQQSPMQHHGEALMTTPFHKAQKSRHREAHHLSWIKQEVEGPAPEKGLYFYLQEGGKKQYLGQCQGTSEAAETC